MKKIILIISLFISSISAMALSVEDNHIIDTQGNKINKKTYNNIVVVDPAVVEIFYLLESQDHIKAIAKTTTTTIWPEKETSKLPSIGTMLKPSIENVIYHNPGLVILSPMNTGFADVLKNRNIPFIVNNGSNFEEILNNTKIYGIIAGNQNKGLEISKIYENKLNKLKTSINDKPLNLKGAFLFSTSPLMAFNSSSLPGEVFKILGIENIADNIPGGRPILSSEYIVASNPDILIGIMNVTKKDDIINTNPIIKLTNAGKNNGISTFESNKILRPTPRVIDAIEELYQSLKS